MSNKKNYHTYDATAVLCLDGRYLGAFYHFWQKLGFKEVDEIKIAGGAKNLVAAKKEFHEETTWDQLDTSIALHGQTRDYPIFLSTHRNCGAYHFEDTEEEQRAHLTQALQEVKAKYPDKEVHMLIVEPPVDGNQTFTFTELTSPNDNGVAKHIIFEYQKP